MESIDEGPETGDGALRLARTVLERVAALALLALILLTAVDVAGRYLLAAPVPGAFEAVRALMGLIIFAGLPLVSGRNEHLRAGLLDHFVSERLNRLREPIVQAASGAVLAVMAWRLVGEAMLKARSQETLMGVPLPLWWLIAFMAAMTAVAAVASEWLALATLRRPPANGAMHAQAAPAAGVPAGQAAAAGSPTAAAR